VLDAEEIDEKLMMTPGDVVMMLTRWADACAGDVALARRRERADPRDARTLHAVSSRTGSRCSANKCRSV